uniref:HMA domain-containing protein n=1 Tax=Pyrodinium bahamense TaxID=73915 RepID=A0A7S0A3D4_9DINO|mmetsp:Transcript_20673/g.57108  ORF Transcript_20673/g.57108 Transcript_20673/m.57108 type:complete len:1006 (+) Transcript_20673:101-3118(+)
MGFSDPRGVEEAPEDLPADVLERGAAQPLKAPSTTSAATSNPASTAASSASTDEKVIDRCATLTVGGMTCSNCSSAVERALGKMQDVVRCEVDLINERAVVWYNSTGGAKPGDFVEEVEDIGFDCSLTEDAAVEQGEADGGQTHMHLICKEKPEAVTELLSSQPGVLDVTVQGQFLKVIYNPQQARARELISMLKASGHEVTLDPAGEAASAAADGGTGVDGAQALLASVCLTGTIVAICWVLPCIPHCLHLLTREIVPGLPVMTFLMCILATPVQIICAQRFHIGAYHSLKTGVWDMNVLISLGTFLTFMYSFTVVIFLIFSPKVRFGHACKAPPPSYFEAPCMVITFILVGKAIESWAKRKTSTSLRTLLALKLSEAHLLSDDGGKGGETEPKKIPMDLVQLGDILQVFPGQAAPADGRMAASAKAGDESAVVATFDESLLTGEARPVPKKQGDFIIGGSKCVSGRVEMKVERLGTKSMLSQITSLVQRAQLSRAPVQQVADAVAHRFVPLVISLAVMTWAVWYWIVYRANLVPLAEILKGRVSDWPELDRFFFVLEHGLTVLLVACPCALGLATPTAVMTATGVAAKHGILIPGGAAPLEVGSKLERVVLDKTGTLTSGQPKVMHAAVVCPRSSSGDLIPEWRKLVEAYQQQHVASEGKAFSPDLLPVAWLPISEPVTAIVVSGTEAAANRARQRSQAERALWWAIGSAEMSSEHPLAKELTDVAARLAQVTLSKPSAFENITGVGVKCSLAGVEVRVASAKHILGPSEEGTGAMADWVRAVKADGATVISVSVDDAPLASIAMRDTLAPHARSCVVEMQMNGLEVWMCTGDHKAAAVAVARECGIDEARIIADALPVDKVAVVQKLQEGDEKGKRHLVAMVGDGVNDAPALAAADLGVAIGAGHDVTVDAADIVLVRTNLQDLVTFLELARITLRTIWRNFLWAFIFNLCALPVAAGAFWRKGITMTPQIAVCLMLASSLFVVFSSLYLKNFQPVLKKFDV